MPALRPVNVPRACWNVKWGLWKECAADLGVKMPAAQANRSVEEVWAHANMAEEDKRLAKRNGRETMVSSCPKGGVRQATNAKPCPLGGDGTQAVRQVRLARRQAAGEGRIQPAVRRESPAPALVHAALGLALAEPASLGPQRLLNDRTLAQPAGESKRPTSRWGAVGAWGWVRRARRCWPAGPSGLVQS
jgi:hypothetical protein